MAQISVEHLTFAYDGGDPLFEDVCFSIDARWRLGLTGRNGRGKTTLLRLLAGRLPDGGAVRGRPACVLFPFSVPDPSLPAGQLLRAFAPDAPEWRCACEADRLGLRGETLARPFAALSGGEQVKCMLAALFVQEEGYCLIDEPTDHLDAEGRACVSRYLKEKDGFLLVRHDRDFLDGCVDHMLALGREEVTLCRGNYSTWEREKLRRDEAERARSEGLRREIARLDQAARRAADWAGKAEAEKHARNSGLRPDRGYLGHKAAKLMKHAKTVQARREEAAAEKRQLLWEAQTAEELRFQPLRWEKASPLVRAEDLTLYYDGRPVCRADFCLRAGRRLALTGPNGCGKSTLLKAVCGVPVERTGTLATAPGLVVSAVPQDPAFLKGELTQLARREGADVTLFFTFLRKLGLERAIFSLDAARLSTGQKKKVLLALSLARPAHLYVWDEPLNYVDVLSRRQIEVLVQKADTAMLVVEHDRAFLRNIGAEILALK